MSIDLIKPGGWALEDPLTSDELNALQAALMQLSVQDDKASQALALSMRPIATSITNPRALALGASLLPGFLRVFAGSTNGILHYQSAEGTLETAGTLASQTFRGVAQAGTELVGRIVGVSNSSSPVHYSDDSGATWTSLTVANSFVSGAPGLDISHAGTVWMAICETTTNAVHTSPTAGSGSWTVHSLQSVAGDLPKRFASSKTSGRSLCVGNNAAASAAFMSQTGDGTNWFPVFLPGGATLAGGSVAWDPRGYFWWAAAANAGGTRLYRSPDTGSTFWTLINTIPNNSREITVDPLTGYIYLAGAGRLMVSIDQGVTFYRINSNIGSVCAVNGILFGLDTVNDILYASALTLVSQ